MQSHAVQRQDGAGSARLAEVAALRAVKNSEV